VAGVVQIYEFVTGTNPGGEAGFVTIYEPRFWVMVSSEKIGNYHETRELTITARWLGLVAVCVGVGMSFCTVPIDGQDLAVTIKLSR
jgi:hypothetical protein